MLALAERGTAAARSLSYAALADYRRCGYRFLAERVLQLGRDGEATIASSGGTGPVRNRSGRRHGLRPGRPRAARVVGAERLGRAARRPDRGDDATGGLRLGGRGAGGRADRGLARLRARGRAEEPVRRPSGPRCPSGSEIDEGTVIRGTIDLLVTGAGPAPDVRRLQDRRGSRRRHPGALRRLRDAASPLRRRRSRRRPGRRRSASAYCFLQAPDDADPPHARTEAEIERGMAGGRRAGRPDPRGRLRADLRARAVAVPRLPGAGPPLPLSARGHAGEGGMTAETGPLCVFAYGSLVSAVSAAETLGRDEALVQPAVLRGWRRSFSLARDNRRCEKTFAAPDGEIPEIVLALNVEPDPTGRAEVNGALIDVTADELARLDRRELRYDRVDVSAAVPRGRRRRPLARRSSPTSPSPRTTLPDRRRVP